jgi:hypothetical protein
VQIQVQDSVAQEAHQMSSYADHVEIAKTDGDVQEQFKKVDVRRHW